MFARLLIEFVLKCPKQKVSEYVKDPNLLTPNHNSLYNDNNNNVNNDNTSSIKISNNSSNSGSNNSNGFKCSNKVLHELKASLILALEHDNDFSPASDQMKRIIGCEYELLLQRRFISALFSLSMPTYSLTHTYLCIVVFILNMLIVLV